MVDHTTTYPHLERRALIKVKSIKPVKEKPRRGHYTKVGRIIINEFLKDKYEHAEVELQFDRPRELYSLYQAMKSLIRRSNPKLMIDVSVNKRERKLYLTKLKVIAMYPTGDEK